MNKRNNKSNKAARRMILVVSIIMLSTVAHVNAAEISGISFDKRYNDEGIEMTLQGTGLKSVAFLKAFVAGYYQGDQTVDDSLGQYPKRVEVEYFVKIPAKKLRNYTIDNMKKNVTKTEFKQLEDEIARMHTYFVDLKPGDRFSLTYLPEIGTKFAYNGQVTGVIEGSDFARALFAVWIGERPFDKKLKKQIMGQVAAQENKERIALRMER